MTCEEINELIVPSIDGELTGDEEKELAAHLAGCPACRKEREELASFMSQVDDSLALLHAETTPEKVAAAKAGILKQLKQPVLLPKVISRPGRAKAPASVFRHFDVVNGLVAAYAGARRMFAEAAPSARRIPITLAVIVILGACLWFALKQNGARYPVVENAKSVTVMVDGHSQILHRGEILRPGSRIIVSQGGHLGVELARKVYIDAASESVLIIPEAGEIQVESGEVHLKTSGEERILRAGERYNWAGE